MTNTVVLLWHGDEPPSKEAGAAGRLPVTKVCLRPTRSKSSRGYSHSQLGNRPKCELHSNNHVDDADNSQYKVQSWTLKAWRH